MAGLLGSRVDWGRPMLDIGGVSGGAGGNCRTVTILERFMMPRGPPSMSGRTWLSCRCWPLASSSSSRPLPRHRPPSSVLHPHPLSPESFLQILSEPCIRTRPSPPAPSSRWSSSSWLVPSSIAPTAPRWWPMSTVRTDYTLLWCANVVCRGDSHRCQCGRF